MPNEAHEYLLGRITPLTSHSFQPKQYLDKPKDSTEESSLINVPIETVVEKRVRHLERQDTFRKSVMVEATKVHPLEKKTKKLLRFRIFPVKKSKELIHHSYPAGEANKHGILTRKQSSGILHTIETPTESSNHLKPTVVKRWLSSEFLAEVHPETVPDTRFASVNGYERSPTTQRKWQQKLRHMFH